MTISTRGATSDARCLADVANALASLPDAAILNLLAGRSTQRDGLIATLHERQREVATTRHRWNAILCGRRSGKTVLDAAILAINLEACGFDEVCVYIARTREIARRLIWGKLKQVQREHGFDWTFNETTLEVRNKFGGYIAIVGADKEGETEKLRGLKLRVAILDEPATYAGLLARLVRDIIEPALGDLRGRIFATGTPGIIRAGWWHEVSTGAREQWHVYHWTVRDNPFFPDAEEWIAGILRENAWSENHPTFIREILGRWVHNVEDLVYRVQPANVVDALPDDYDRDQWRHVLAIDYGVTDSTAWVVLAWNPKPPKAPIARRAVYVIATEKRAGLAPSTVADITKAYCDTYKPEVTVGDSGGLGKAMIQEMNARFPGYPIIAADKTEKRAFIEHLNGDLMSCMLLFVRASCSALLAEAAVLPWKQQKIAIAGDVVTHEIADPGYEDHLCDALLYGWRWTLAHTTTPVELSPLPPTPFDLLRPGEWDGWAPSSKRDLLS